MVFTIVLARLVGPESFGIVAQAVVYMVLVGLLLDQGFSSALIQRPFISDALPGAIVTVTLFVGFALTVCTVAVAPAWADFMDTPELRLILMLLAPSLLIRAWCVTPRALLLRRMSFRAIGIADITAAMVGGALGVAAAVYGAGYWALVVQIVTTDLMLMTMFVVLRAGVRPNLHLKHLSDIVGFSIRAFAAGVVTSIARNIDNLLVGKYQGPEALAFYGLGYRLLLFPVQLLSGTIGGVLFPAFARLADDLTAVRWQLSRTTRILAVVVLPAMTLVAAASPQVVPLLFGGAWKPAVPIVQVLAFAGAIQAIYQPSTVPLVLGLGHAKLNLRYALLTTTVATAGIVAGVPFSPLAVAIGYAAATASLIPVEWLLRRHLLGIGLFDQARSLVPGIHVAVWMAATYVVFARTLDPHDFAALAVGVPISISVGLAVLRLAHRNQFDELSHVARRLLGRTQLPDVRTATFGQGR